MKKIYRYVIILFVMFVSFSLVSSIDVKAADMIASASEEIFGEEINNIKVYSNGKVNVQYKYGLRRLDMYYCLKGEQCDNSNYYMIVIAEASEEEPYKNEGVDLASYDFNINIAEPGEYRVRIEAYFATSSAYTGTESIYGYPIGAVQVADTKEYYINSNAKESSSSGISDERIKGLLDKIKSIVNSVILPIIYIATTLFLIIKGAILGVQIVKSADDASVRREKIGALKWLVIGVAITYAATSVVGVLTGFFKNFFELNF